MLWSWLWLLASHKNGQNGEENGQIGQSDQNVEKGQENEMTKNIEMLRNQLQTQQSMSKSNSALLFELLC